MMHKDKQKMMEKINKNKNNQQIRVVVMIKSIEVVEKKCLDYFYLFVYLRTMIQEQYQYHWV